MRTGDNVDVPESWNGKVVFVYLRGGGGTALQGGIAMRDVRVETVNGRAFLSGRALSDPRDWTADLPLLVLWDEVVHIVLIDSPKEFMMRWERALARTPPGDDDIAQA